MRRIWAVLLGILLLAMVIGCGSKPANDEGAQSSPAPGNEAAPGTTASKGGGKAPSMLDRLTKKTVTVPEGTVISVRINESLSSKTSQPGENFTGVVDEPVDVDGKVAIPKGADASGTVVDAKALGKFKGGAKLQVALNSVSFGGNTYNLETSSVARSAKGKGKRTAVMIGGGAGLGALIGGLAGGGKGAAIGALVGAGAGTGGAYFTGNKDVVIPAEAILSFKLLKPVDVKE
ncbi:MAG TPA: hypothetical protein VL382_08275 [Terriglobales bacterium]|nr:hypothetical protein [Terriglobales bacterium]